MWGGLAWKLDALDLHVSAGTPPNAGGPDACWRKGPGAGRQSREARGGGRSGISGGRAGQRCPAGWRAGIREGCAGVHCSVREQDGNLGDLSGPFCSAEGAQAAAG